MKKLTFIAALLLLAVTLSAQVRFTGTVLNWTPPAGSDGDTIVKTNLYLTDDYLLGLSWDCEGCDSLYLKYKWSNDSPDSTYFLAPMYQSGSAIDSIFINGDSQGGVYVESTPFPYNAIETVQVGGTNPSKIVIKRTITTKHR